MSNYTQQKNFVWGPCGALGKPPGRPLELPLVRGNCAYVSRGIDAPGFHIIVQNAQVTVNLQTEYRSPIQRGVKKTG